MKFTSGIRIFVAGLCAGAAGAGATGHQVYVNYGSGANAIPWWAHPTLTSMRCQMLYDRSYISYAGTITEFMLEKTDATSATFTNVKFYLCHTPLSYLTLSFQGNYGGNTPKLVASFASYRVPAVGGPYPIPMAENFGYNNVDNLLLEVSWEASELTNAMCRLKTGSVPGHRCFAWDYRATTGSVDVIAYNAFIDFDKYPAVRAASFGSVRALYR
jgi:hypothetical protein